MAERIITDASGRRWDVSQQATRADPPDVTRERPLRFRRQTGEVLEAKAPAPLDELSDQQLLEVLERMRSERGDESVDERGPDRGQDPAGYVSG